MANSPPALWDFMLTVYDLPGVAAACLDLQHAYGVDVPILLAALHGTGRGLRIDAAAVAVLDARCERWRVEVVQPLRAIRTRLRSNPWMEKIDTVPSFRESIKGIELRAEKIEVQALDEALATLAYPDPARRPTVVAFHAAARHVVEYFARHRFEDLPQDVARVADAGWSLARDWKP